MGNRSNISLVGNTTTGQNLGSGACVYKCKSTGNNLQFRTISSTGTSIQIFETANQIYISGSTCVIGGTGFTVACNGLSSCGASAVVLGGNLTNNTIINACGYCMSICNLPAKTTETCAVYIDSAGMLSAGVVCGGSGTITGATNLGSGNGTIYTTILDKNLQFKTLSGGTNITLTCNGNYIGVNTPTISIPITGASNGLSVTGKQIKLGGTLTGTTTINGAQTLNINQTILNLSGNTCVSITGAVKLTTTPASGAASLTALLWDSGTTLVKGVPVIDEWVGSIAELLYAGQKFTYPTQAILQTDVGTCVTIPNYILIQNINLESVGDTLAFTIPSSKTAMLNRAKLIFLCNATPTSFCVSIGNNYCATPSLSYNNLANLQQICDVLINQTLELDLSTRSPSVPESSGSIVYFRVGNASACPLCAHLLIEGFVY